MFRDKPRRPILLIAEFRMLVDISPPGDQLGFDRRGPFSDFLFQGRTRRSRCQGRADNDEHDCRHGVCKSCHMCSVGPQSWLHEFIAKFGICRMCTITEGFVPGPAATAKGHTIAYFVRATVSADEPDASTHPQGT